MSDPQKRYPPELRERAVRMVLEARAADPADTGAITRISKQLGVGTESLRNWVKQDPDRHRGSSGDDHRGAQAHRRAREGEPRTQAVQRDPAPGLGVFRPGGARPPVEVIVGFIDANRDELGVEPICRDLQVAPSTYYAAKSRPLSARAVRDAMLIPLLVHDLGARTSGSMGCASSGRRPGAPATTSGGTRWPASWAWPASRGCAGARSARPPRPIRPLSATRTWSSGSSVPNARTPCG